LPSTAAVVAIAVSATAGDAGVGSCSGRLFISDPALAIITVAGKVNVFAGRKVFNGNCGFEFYTHRV
jgi:hypothetical protein